MTIYTSTPYTYRIKWSSTGVSYYGVQYSSKSNPNNLWKTYFTSSRYVKEYVALYGNPDIIEIRKTFSGENRVQQAREWEHRVLSRLQVTRRADYLNKGTGKGIPLQFGNDNPMCLPGVKEKHLTVVQSSEHRAKLKQTLNTPEHRERNSRNQKVAQNRPDVKAAKSKRTTEYFQKPEVKQKHKNSCNSDHFKSAMSNKTSDTVWINDGSVQKYVKQDQVENYLSSGWVTGMLNQKHNTGKRMMNNTVDCKMVHPDDFGKLVAAGWTFGMIKSR